MMSDVVSALAKEDEFQKPAGHSNKQLMGLLVFPTHTGALQYGSILVIHLCLTVLPPGIIISGHWKKDCREKDAAYPHVLDFYTDSLPNEKKLIISKRLIRSFLIQINIMEKGEAVILNGALTARVTAHSIKCIANPTTIYLLYF
jgi:hypothetical protein